MHPWDEGLEPQQGVSPAPGSLPAPDLAPEAVEEVESSFFMFAPPQ